MSIHKIVGAHFHPPSKSILACLHGGCPLLVAAEPDNPYDPNAMKVSVHSAAIKESQHETLDTMAQAQGSDLETILAQEEWQLGFIPAKDAVDLVKKFNAAPAYDAKLGFDEKGSPAVILDLAEPEEQAQPQSAPIAQELS